MNFSYQKTLADELREMAEDSGNKTLNEFINYFTDAASVAAKDGKHNIIYPCKLSEVRHKEKIGKWLGDNGLAFQFNSDQRDGNWFDISW